MNSISLPKHRLEWLDCLRGIAALMVVVLHLWLSLLSIYKLSLTGSLKIISYFIFGYLDFGKIGVVAFFLISGYVIPYSFRGKTNKQFFLNRFFRLYPAYWVSILSLIIIIGLPPIKDLLANITMFQRFLGVNDLIGAFWTLQIELIFYIFCAVLHYFKLLESDKFIFKTIVVLIGLTLVIAFLRFELDKKLPVALFLALIVMFLGLMWRRATLDKSAFITKPLVYKILFGFIVVLLPITLLAYSKDYGYNETWYRYFFSYLLALGIFFVFSFYKFVNSVLLYLGSISYSLYLLHAVFGLEFTVIVLKFLKTNNIYLYIVIFFVLSFVSATLCYFFVEKPCVRLGKKIVNRLNGKHNIQSTDK